MSSEDELLKQRFCELARKSERGGYFLFTDFLGLPEQSAFSDAKIGFGRARYTFFGSTVGTERIMVRFGDEDELGYSEPFPIKILKISPKSQKFADKLTHRDFLGAILNLGIERSTLGDIVISDNVAYVFVKEGIADYIAASLERVKHTDVTTEQIDEGELPEGELFKTEEVRIQLSGERIDAVIAKVFSLSREEALTLFRRRLVFVSGRLCENNSYTPKVGDIISTRGYGRIIYRGAYGTSKKGKLNVLIEKYI